MNTTILQMNYQDFIQNILEIQYQKNGRVRKWYEVLKEGTETVIDRIFITGVAPITLDSLTKWIQYRKRYITRCKI